MNGKNIFILNIKYWINNKFYNRLEQYVNMFTITFSVWNFKDELSKIKLLVKYLKRVYTGSRTVPLSIERAVIVKPIENTSTYYFNDIIG